MYLKAMLVNAIFCPSAAKQMGSFFCTKKPFALICYLLIFNQQIMTFLFDLFLSVELYQLQCFCVDHILDGILDTHTKRRTFWTIVINILISNNIQYLDKMIHLILNTFKLEKVSSHHPQHMCKLHIISSSD